MSEKTYQLLLWSSHQKLYSCTHSFLRCMSHSSAHLWCQSVVVRRLAGQQDVRESLLLPHHDVSESTVVLILSHVVPEPLVKHVAFFLPQLPLYRAGEMHLSIRKWATWHRRGDTGQSPWEDCKFYSNKLVNAITVTTRMLLLHCERSNLQVLLVSRGPFMDR